MRGRQRPHSGHFISASSTFPRGSNTTREVTALALTPQTLFASPLAIKEIRKVTHLKGREGGRKELITPPQLELGYRLSPGECFPAMDLSQVLLAPQGLDKYHSYFASISKPLPGRDL